MRLPSTRVTSLSAQTRMPTGEAEMWVMFMAVPTVLSPGARWGAMEVQAAFSIRAVIKGVP